MKIWQQEHIYFTREGGTLNAVDETFDGDCVAVEIATLQIVETTDSRFIHDLPDISKARDIEEVTRIFITSGWNMV